MSKTRKVIKSNTMPAILDNKSAKNFTYSNSFTFLETEVVDANNEKLHRHIKIMHMICIK